MELLKKADLKSLSFFFLLAEGIDANMQDRDGEIALHRARENDYLEVVQLLLSSTPVSSRNLNTALLVALRSGKWRIVEVAVTKGGATFMGYDDFKLFTDCIRPSDRHLCLTPLRHPSSLRHLIAHKDYASFEQHIVPTLTQATKTTSFAHRLPLLSLYQDAVDTGVPVVER